MSFVATVQCRIRQAILRPGRRMSPAGWQIVEEGPGSVFSVAQILRSNRLKKPLVVVGRGGEPWSGRVVHALEESDIAYALWEDLEPEPTVDDAEKLRYAFRELRTERCLDNPEEEAKTPLELGNTEKSAEMRTLAEDYSAMRYGEIPPSPEAGRNASLAHEQIYKRLRKKRRQTAGG